MRTTWIILAAVSFALAASAADRAKPQPAPGQAFSFDANAFKYVNSDIEFRDPAGAKWPNFFSGKPAGGRLAWDPKAPQAKFEVRFDRMAQEKGDQSRKVLGEWCRPGEPPTVTLAVNEMKAPAVETVTVQGKRGPEQKQKELSELDAALDIGGRRIAVRPKASIAFHAGKSGQIERITLESTFTLTAQQLGLKALPADAAVEVRFTANGAASQ